MRPPQDAVCSPAQMSAIQGTVSTFGNEALRVFNNHEAQARFSVDLRTPSPRTLNTATPLGLHRPLEKTSKTKYSAVSTFNFDCYFPTLCTENSYPGS